MEIEGSSVEEELLETVFSEVEWLRPLEQIIRQESIPSDRVSGKYLSIPRTAENRMFFPPGKTGSVSPKEYRKPSGIGSS